MKLSKFGTYCLTLLVYFELFSFEYLIILRYKDMNMSIIWETTFLEHIYGSTMLVILFSVIIIPFMFFLILLIDWLKIKWFASLLITFILHNFFFVYVLGEVHAKDRPEIELMMMFIPLILNSFIIWLLFRNTFKRLDAEDNLGYIPFRNS